MSFKKLRTVENYWETKDGRRVLPSLMTDSHLNHSIAMLIRRPERILVDELERRRAAITEDAAD
jgi:hypothetical protein